MRRLLALLLALVLTGTSAGALGSGGPSASAPSAHACCAARMRAERSCHAAVLSCCRAPQRERDTTVPPASGPLVAAPELAAAQGVAAVAPDALATARGFALAAHAEGRLKSPPAPVYLRNAAFLV